MDIHEGIIPPDDEPATKGWEPWQLLKTTCVEWWNDDTFRLAASLAFYTIFSLAPVLLIVVGVASLFLARETATQRIVTEVQRMIGNNGAQAIKQVLDASSGFGKSVSAIATGVVTFLLGASAVFAELQDHGAFRPGIVSSASASCWVQIFSISRRFWD